MPRCRMNGFFHIVILVLCVQLNAAELTPAKDRKLLFAQWAKIKDPSPGPINPIGSYQAGCLTGAVPIPIDGAGYAGMRLNRHRLFGHSDMLTYIHDLSEHLRLEKMPLLLIGDVGAPRG